MRRISEVNFNSLENNRGCIIYFASLLFCIYLSTFFKHLSNTNAKKCYGAGLGLLVTSLVCGWKTIYCIILVLVNLLIIKCCNKQYIHQMCMAFTLLYMVFLQNQVLHTWCVRWIVEIIALRMMGVAFSIHKMNYNKNSTMNPDPIKEEPLAADIVCYGFCYLGIHKGPYYRFKTYNDYFTRPFGATSNSRAVTTQKIKMAALCASIYIVLLNKYNSSLYYNDEFYANYPSDYRFLFNAPQLLMYVLFNQTVISLCTGACTEAGFGLYPAKTTPVPGYGPTTNLDVLTASAEKLDSAVEYNFDTLTCIDFTKIVIGPRMKDTLRGWNMATQRWFIENTYSSLLNSSEEVRSACSFVAWTLWSGAGLGKVILSSTNWVYIHLEAEYADLCSSMMNEEMKSASDVGSSIFRVLCLIYLTPCLVIDDYRVILRYYNSIYWIYHAMLFSLLITFILAYMKK